MSLARNTCPLSFEELAVQDNPRQIELKDLTDYDFILVSYSGGKDSLACILYLLELGIPKERIQLWHQDVDGGSTGSPLMDWPVTKNYVVVTGEALGIKTEFQWREGGFKGELLRENALTGPVGYTYNGKEIHLPTRQGKRSTRRKFPAKSPDLRRRWCTPYLKIDVFRRVINNNPDFQNKNILVITGERREESPARSKYLETEIHPCNAGGRVVHWWRSVIDWPESIIWGIIERHRIAPHPAYLLGWNRTSCFGCVFSTPDLWHMMREIAPERFNYLVELEKELNFTIDNNLTLSQMADKGKSRIPDGKERLVKLALEGGITTEEFFQEKWELPAGAFRGAEGGPI